MIKINRISMLLFFLIALSLLYQFTPELIYAKLLGAELAVPPVIQLSPVLENGGTTHCLAASTTMVLQYFMNIGKIPASSTVDYLSVSNKFGPLEMDGGYSLEKSNTTINELSNNYLTSNYYTRNKEDAINSLIADIDQGFPVIMPIIYANKLESAKNERLNYTMPHAITVIDATQDSITFIDPWNGKKYIQNSGDFLSAWGEPYYSVNTRLSNNTPVENQPEQPTTNISGDDCSCVTYVVNRLFGSPRNNENGTWGYAKDMDSDKYWTQSDVNPIRRITDNPKSGDVIIFNPEATFYIKNTNTQKWATIKLDGVAGHIGIITKVERIPGFWILDISHANWSDKKQLLNQSYRSENRCSNIGDSRVKIPDHQPVHFWTPVDSSSNQPQQPDQTPASENRPPNTPQITSPDNWYVTQEPKVQLCATSKGDPDGDQTNEFYFEIYESAQLWNSGWIANSCVTTDLLGMFTYKWHVKVRDSKEAESAWSEDRNFSIREAERQTEPPQNSGEPSGTVPCFEQPGNNCNMEVGIAAPLLVKPLQNKYFDVGDNINLVWKSVAGATDYQVVYGLKGDTGKNLSWIKGTKYPLGVVKKTDRCKTYWWQVNVRSGLGSSMSEVRKFSIKCPDLQPDQAPPDKQAPTENNPPQDNKDDVGMPTLPEIPVDNCGVVGCQPKSDVPNGNIAPQARREPDGIGSENAFDGNISTFWNRGLGHGFSLKLSWDTSVGVNRIIIYDRPSNSPDNNQINRIKVSLSNGMSKEFDMLSQSDRCVNIMLDSAQHTNAVTLSVVDGSGDNGLSEIEIWSGRVNSGLDCANGELLP
ncbi:MAG: C39 family peptidase [Chloroflexota bacterium]